MACSTYINASLKSLSTAQRTNAKKWVMPWKKRFWRKKIYKNIWKQQQYLAAISFSFVSSKNKNYVKLLLQSEEALHMHLTKLNVDVRPKVCIDWRLSQSKKNCLQPLDCEPQRYTEDVKYIYVLITDLIFATCSKN